MSMPQYVLILRQALVDELRVIMSRSATHFLSPYTMSIYSHCRVYTDLNDIDTDVQIPHIDLTEDIDLFLIMPATANIIGKAANGICDDLISTAIVACAAPVVLVPTMNGVMWRSAAVQSNVARAREHGYHVIDPEIGMQLADMRDAPGAMPSLDHILDRLIAIIASADPVPTEMRR